MHPNPAFRPEDQTAAWALVEHRGFGILTLQGAGQLLASHIPFVVEDGRVMAHLVRSNPMVRALQEAPQEALLIVSGPDAYISPDWYDMPDQVPTWNYVAVHLRGTLALAAPETLQPHLEALSAHQEKQLLPKPVWTHHKMAEGTMDRMMRQILPVMMDVRDIHSTWKLNQNKPEKARLAAADAVETQGIGQNPQTLAQLMRGIGS